MSEAKHTPGPVVAGRDKDIGKKLAGLLIHNQMINLLEVNDALKKRVAELVAINDEMFIELEAQRRACKWMPEQTDCSDAHCTNQDSCSLLKVIRKAMEV